MIECMYCGAKAKKNHVCRECEKMGRELQKKLDAMPKHGDRRNNRIESNASADQYIEKETGKVIDVTYTSKERTIYEAYCSHCKEWIECRSMMDYFVCNKCGTSWDERTEEE